MRLSCSVSHPSSARSFSIPQSLVAPLTIRPALLCIDIIGFCIRWSNCPKHYHYIRVGAYEVYIYFSSAILFILNFRARRRFNLNHADLVILAICSVHEQVFEKVTPRCLWLVDSEMTVSFIKSCGCKTGFCFKDIKRDIVFLALKSTSQSRVHWDMVPRSKFIVMAAVWEFSTMIYKLVSSAKRRTEEFMFLKISFIKIRKSRGPSIEPWGTPAYTDAHSDKAPLRMTHCRRFDR